MISLALGVTLLLGASDAGVLLSRPVKVTADALRVFNKENRAVYEGHATAVRDSMTLTCDTLIAHYNSKQQVTLIEMKGHVRGVDGARWATGDEATFDNLSGQLVATGHPEGGDGARHVVGTRVTFATDRDEMQVEDAKTSSEEKTPQGARRIDITADHMTMESKRHLATWVGHVVARRDGTVVRAPKMIAYSDDSGAVSRVEAVGGVDVTDRDRWARGSRMDYDNRSGVLVVTGKPEARQGTHRMRGSRVTFHSDRDFLEVENAVTIVDGTARKPAP